MKLGGVHIYPNCLLRIAKAPLGMRKGWICLVLVPGGYVKQLRVFEDFPEKF